MGQSRLQIPYTPPEWLTNEQPDDPYWLQVARRAAKLVGVGDPVSIGMGMPGAALETGAVDAAGQVIKGPMAKLGDVVRRGLYSRLDDYAKLIGKEGVSPARLAKIVSKDTALAEEAAFRQVPQLIEAGGGKKVTQKTIPLSQVQAHLQAHPAPKPVVKTLTKTPEGNAVAQQWQASMDAADHAWQQWQEAQTMGAAPEVVDAAQARWRAHSDEADRLYGAWATAAPETHQPRFENYTVPGGDNYRETLLKLPTERQWVNGAPITAEDLATPAGREAADRVGAPVGPVFESGHFRDDSNILVHTRANERTLPTGERGRFIEEVQSDWHQAGKKKGYGTEGQQVTAFYRTSTGQRVPLAHGATEEAARAAVPAGWDTIPGVTIETEARTVPIPGGVPDAPFKETWPDLGLKQQVLEAAADPHAQWIGHTAGSTQAARYDLSKQISELHYSGTNLKAYDHSGKEVISQTGVTREQLPDYIGKEAATKLLAQPKQGSLQSLTGVDLQVGGEGMHEFYDKLLPSRLQKILRPFGGTVEQVKLGARSKAMIDAEMDALHHAGLSDEAFRVELNRLQHERGSAVADPAWIAKLTPEMKARILKEGLPLSVLLGLIPLSQVGTFGPPPPESR